MTYENILIHTVKYRLDLLANRSLLYNQSEAHVIPKAYKNYKTMCAAAFIQC